MLAMRPLGTTGIMVGEVGLGCEGLLDKPAEYYSIALDKMQAAGANAIDLYSPNPQFRDYLGHALQGRRDKFVLEGHICSIWKNGQYERSRNLEETRAAFEDQLARFKTDYMDIGMIHYVDADADWQKVLDNGILDYARKLKTDGKIRAIGLSSHNPKVALRTVQEGGIEVLLFAVNPCYDLQPAREDVEQLWKRENYAAQLTDMDADRAKLHEVCQAMGVGITVMKAFGGGDLLKADQSLAGVALTVDQCLAYALDRPGVACVFAGAHSLEELESALAYGEADAARKDYAAALASFPRISWKGHCMYCGHCAPCPAGINVAMVTKLLNLAQAQKSVPETVREHYKALSAHAEDCLHCGDCESRCPFDVFVRKNMDRALCIFGQ